MDYVKYGIEKKYINDKIEKKKYTNSVYTTLVALLEIFIEPFNAPRFFQHARNSACWNRHPK